LQQGFDKLSPNGLQLLPLAYNFPFAVDYYR